MKTANIFPSLLLLCGISLLGGCATFEDAQWPEGGGDTAHPMWGNRLHHSACQNHPNSLNSMGSMSGASIFSMRSESFTFCHKCGRYVRESQ